jgi:hypothetical protein
MSLLGKFTATLFTPLNGQAPIGGRLFKNDPYDKGADDISAVVIGGRYHIAPAIRLPFDVYRLVLFECGSLQRLICAPVTF